MGPRRASVPRSHFPARKKTSLNMKILVKSALELIKPFTLFCLAVSAVPLACPQMSESSPELQDKPIVIRVSHPDTRQEIAPTLFGSFLEPIGHSTYGGLWANVVENPSFEEGLWSGGISRRCGIPTLNFVQRHRSVCQPRGSHSI
jgi:alpha-N-arabinofuranosidase